MLACRALTDSAARLACYDKAAATISDAINAKELVMIDKAKAAEVKRSLFGYSAPNFAGLLGGGEVKQVEGVVASAFTFAIHCTIDANCTSSATTNSPVPDGVRGPCCSTLAAFTSRIVGPPGRAAETSLTTVESSSSKDVPAPASSAVNASATGAL